MKPETFDAIYREHLQPKRARWKAVAKWAPKRKPVVVEIPQLPGHCADCGARVYLDFPHWVDESGHPHRCRLGK